VFRIPGKCSRPSFYYCYDQSVMTAIIQQFKAFLYQVGYSESTVNMLPACVREFIEHQQITHLHNIEQQKVKAFYGWLQTRPLKKRSGALSDMMISHYMYALRTFFNWAQATGQTDHNPLSGMKFKRATQNARQPLSIEEMQQLFAVTGTLKETALLHLFYSCGLRRKEAEALNSGDIHFALQLLYVREGKGSRRRVVPLTERVSRELEDYYRKERSAAVARNVKDQEAFMLNSAGRRMKGSQYNKLLKELSRKATITSQVTLHHLRHSIATHLLQSGMSMEYVRDFLGHRFLETTQIYAKPKPGQLKSL
jgi:integrase/recombinase XerD